MEDQEGSSKSAKMSGYIYVFTVQVLRVTFTLSSTTSLESVTKLCDVNPYIEKDDYDEMCERINENLKQCSLRVKAADGHLRCVKKGVFVYVFPRQVAFSSANSHNLFRIPSTRLGHPPTNHELITVDEVSKVLVIDERKFC